jgi:hypothetical protein
MPRVFTFSAALVADCATSAEDRTVASQSVKPVANIADQPDPGIAPPPTVCRTPGISCERPICSTLVCFIPLFDGAVRNLTMVRTCNIMPRMTGRHAIAGRNLPTRAGRVRRLDFADRSAA